MTIYNAEMNNCFCLFSSFSSMYTVNELRRLNNKYQFSIYISIFKKILLKQFHKHFLCLCQSIAISTNYKVHKNTFHVRVHLNPSVAMRLQCMALRWLDLNLNIEQLHDGWTKFLKKHPSFFRDFLFNFEHLSVVTKSVFILLSCIYVTNCERFKQLWITCKYNL